MRQKKNWCDSLLTIAVLFSLFRGGIDEYMRGSFSNLPEVHDILLGQSVALTETQFHNLFNSFEGHRISDVHPKNLDIDWHHRSVFTDLHALYRESNQNPREVTAFLLDRLEASPAHPYPSVNLVQNPSNTNNNANSNTDEENNSDNNNNEDGSNSGGSHMNEDDNVVGAVASPQVEEFQLLPEDLDLMDSEGLIAWKQQMDMGIDIEDDVQDSDVSKKINKEAWDNIDADSGEHILNPSQSHDNLVNFQQHSESPQRPSQDDLVNYLPPCYQHPQPSQRQSQDNLVNFQQHSHPSQRLTVQTQQSLQQPALPPSENNSFYIDCFQLPDNACFTTGTSPTESSSTFQSQENEQRWNELASIPELRNQLHDASSEASVPTSQFQLPQHHHQENQPVMNMTQPAVDNPFMMNATTNGNVNLQNATNNIVPQALPQVDNTTVIQPPSVPSNENPTSASFSPLSLNTTSPTAGSQTMNYTGFLPEGRQVDRFFEGGHANFSAESTSQLLELLNESTADEIDFSDLQNLSDAFGVNLHSPTDSGRDSSSPYDLQDETLCFSDPESLGATGYNSSLDGDHLKGATGGYGYGRRRGERQYTGDNSGNSYSGHPPNMENIQHNHTYAGSSGTQNGKTGGGNNGTSQSNDTEQQKRSRDQKRAEELNLDISIQQVTNLPVDQFNELLKSKKLNDAQTSLIRDIRRRGKNKVAAQNCRRRKIDAIAGMEHEIDRLKSQKIRLIEQNNEIDKKTMEVNKQYEELEDSILQKLQCDPRMYKLKRKDGEIFIVPRNDTSTHKEDEH